MGPTHTMNEQRPRAASVDIDLTAPQVPSGPPGPPAAGALPAATAHAPASAPALRIAVKGLRPAERQLLEGLVRVSQRRNPRLELLADEQSRMADVVVIDTRDAQAMAWARRHPWLSRRAVIWIDGDHAQQGHTIVRRPVQWPILPMVLARALEHGPGVEEIPDSESSKLAAQTELEAALHPESAPRVLVVDDSVASRNHIRSLLEKRGYHVTDLECVNEAMTALKQRRYDCVLMDVLMPQVDGYEGCSRIKATMRGDNAVPVVMLTSKSSPFDRIRGKMAGCDAYLTKPVEPQHLAEVLAQHVRHAHHH